MNFKIFFQRFKKNKTPNRRDQHDKENDTKLQQRQWFTDTVDKNASTQSSRLPHQ